MIYLNSILEYSKVLHYSRAMIKVKCGWSIVNCGWSNLADDPASQYDAPICYIFMRLTTIAEDCWPVVGYWTMKCFLHVLFFWKRIPNIQKHRLHLSINVINRNEIYYKLWFRPMRNEFLSLSCLNIRDSEKLTNNLKYLPWRFSIAKSCQMLEYLLVGWGDIWSKSGG